MERMDSLLLKAAEALENGADPFSNSFLAENGVTLDECMTLSERIGIICKGWLSSGRDDRIKILALGAVHGAEGVDMDVFRAHIEHRQAADRAFKRTRATK